WEIPIEVYGVVYLFNPVDIDRLGLGKVTDETEIEMTVDVPAETEVVETPPADGAGQAVVPGEGVPGEGVPGPAAGGETTDPTRGAPTAPGAGNPGAGTPGAGTPGAGTPGA